MEDSSFELEGEDTQPTPTPEADPPASGGSSSTGKKIDWKKWSPWLLIGGVGIIVVFFLLHKESSTTTSALPGNATDSSSGNSSGGSGSATDSGSSNDGYGAQNNALLGQLVTDYQSLSAKVDQNHQASAGAPTGNSTPDNPIPANNHTPTPATVPNPNPPAPPPTPNPPAPHQVATNSGSSVASPTTVHAPATVPISVVNPDVPVTTSYTPSTSPSPLSVSASTRRQTNPVSNVNYNPVPVTPTTALVGTVHDPGATSIVSHPAVTPTVSMPIAIKQAQTTGQSGIIRGNTGAGDAMLHGTGVHKVAVPVNTRPGMHHKPRYILARN